MSQSLSTGAQLSGSLRCTWAYYQVVRWLRGLVLSQGLAELDQYMVIQKACSDGYKVRLSWGIAGTIPTL
jgi:hypothetical protein